MRLRGGGAGDSDIAVHTYAPIFVRVRVLGGLCGLPSPTLCATASWAWLQIGRPPTQCLPARTHTRRGTQRLAFIGAFLVVCIYKLAFRRLSPYPHFSMVWTQRGNENLANRGRSSRWVHVSIDLIDLDEVPHPHLVDSLDSESEILPGAQRPAFTLGLHSELEWVITKPLLHARLIRLRLACVRRPDATNLHSHRTPLHSAVSGTSKEILRRLTAVQSVRYAYLPEAVLIAFNCG